MLTYSVLFRNRKLSKQRERETGASETKKRM